ncbi:MAG: RagB/SusD family nutrient uptake outer membrane protein [Bacteroidia bacterium]|nr:RagB/SusD family nutrient uptake outer membrane protein [Bacteroidia bacterium]
MKINNVIKATRVIFISLLFFSCQKDFLNKNPLDKVSSGTFWKSDADLQMALAGCYDRLKGDGWGGFPNNYQGGYMDGLSDVAYVYWSLFSISDMSRGNITPSSDLVGNYYRCCYRAISSCNYFLDHIDKVTTVADAKKNIYKGEVRFIRALYYFNLVTTFGGVPLYKTLPVDAASSKIAKSTAAEVFAFITEDLDNAISVLPDIPYTDGHAVKGSVMGIKIRVLLTQEKWTEAATLAQQIMSSGKFSLYNDYPSMFVNKGQVNNPEIMFSCRYLSPDASGVYGYNIEYSAHIFLRQSFRDAFECTDGKAISESPLYNAANPYVNRDPRFYYTIRQPGQDWPGFYSYNTFNPSGVLNRKYLDPTISGDYSNAFLDDWDFIILRYADVLLMYAEAKNEASGPDASVYAAINQVRSRPGVNMPLVDQSKYNNQSSVRDYIRHEREVELGVEGVRYYDLKRWKIADTFLPTIKDADGNFLVFTQKQYLWPFPQSDLDANPQLVQNPGY